jgi:hypothetical protein
MSVRYWRKVQWYRTSAIYRLKNRREALYNILIEFGIPRKLVGLIKICLNETYSRVRIGKKLSDKFSIENGLKQGDALSSLPFNFALKYAIRRAKERERFTSAVFIEAEGTDREPVALNVGVGDPLCWMRLGERPSVRQQWCRPCRPSTQGSGIQPGVREDTLRFSFLSFKTYYLIYYFGCNLFYLF